MKHKFSHKYQTGNLLNTTGLTPVDNSQLMIGKPLLPAPHVGSTSAVAARNSAQLMSSSAATAGATTLPQVKKISIL